jgi:hypothetical protein
MNETNRRIREAVARGSGALRGAVTWRGPHRRVRMMVAAVAATVLAIGVGTVWGLAGADDNRSEAADAASPFTAPGGSPDIFGDAFASPGPLGGGGSSTGGGGFPGGSGSGSGPGDSGGGPPGNRPPVIEDPGLSSDGMTLRIAPSVTDPDGDEVDVGYDVLGKGFLSVAERPTYTFPVKDFGYSRKAEVTIVAIDAHGATTQETFTHQLEAVSTVVLEDATVTVRAPQICFANAAAERFTADLRLRRAVVLDRPISKELTLENPAATLLPDPVEAVVSGQPPQLDVFLANASLMSGAADSVSVTNIGPPGGAIRRQMFQTHPCRINFDFHVRITTR